MNEITAPTLRRLMENDPTLHEVRVSTNYFFNVNNGVEFYNSEPSIAYVFPRGNIGWKMAGEHIGNNNSIRALAMRGIDGGIKNLEAFFNGVSRNNSIDRISFSGWDMLGGAPFLFMAPLLENNSNLAVLELLGCPLGNDGVRLLASALSSCTHCLESIKLISCSIESGEPFEELVAALNTNLAGRAPTLNCLDLCLNNIGRNGCAILATLLSNPRCELNTLKLVRNNIDDEGVICLADGLAKNDKLTLLDVAIGNPITNQGWATLSKALCNKNSINDTFLSNHRLKDLGHRHRLRSVRVRLPADLDSYLALNKKGNVDQCDYEQAFAPIQKILDNHHDWNMSQFIEEELKFLPYILSWFERADITNTNFNGIATKKRKQNRSTLQSRRILTIDQFVKYVPVIVVETLALQLRK